MENNQSIGAKILALRKARGYTQADLGAYLNISYQAVSKWERGESFPDFITMSRIAQFFNVPITYFEEGGDGETAVAEQPAAVANADNDILGVVSLVCKKIEKALDVHNFNILNNCGVKAGQTVDHFHIHIIPLLCLGICR